ncbi:hypothetical protein CBS63078_7682 [Aspergillus niger]|nr:hypothetical protein CBS63078_7682 [Aspergillus niger]KAI2964037.1 hypothetical protein CBS147323_6531 [Aspergillus niger]KAI3021977.1 hypothetical protein CBS147347_7661 [Aspergillus niger]KAI3061145.1 hypothetical protein CBS147353_10079 [Aspergillus niger]
MSHELNIPKAYMRRVEQGLESIPDGLPETLGLNWAESSGMMRQKSARRSAVQSPSTLRGFLPASPISTSIVWRISVIRRINLYTQTSPIHTQTAFAAGADIWGCGVHPQSATFEASVEP